MGLISESLDEMTNHRPCFAYSRISSNNLLFLCLLVFVQRALNVWIPTLEDISRTLSSESSPPHTVPLVKLVAGLLIPNSAMWYRFLPREGLHKDRSAYSDKPHIYKPTTMHWSTNPVSFPKENDGYTIPIQQSRYYEPMGYNYCASYVDSPRIEPRGWFGSDHLEVAMLSFVNSYEFRRNRKEILRNEGKRPTWWKDVLQDSHVWDVGLSLTCFLTYVTVVLFLIAGADLVRISTAESPRGLDSASSYASNTVVQLMAGLTVTSIMTSTALAWVAIGTWPKPRIRRTIEAAIVRWLCTVHGPTLGSWLFMSGAASLLYTHAKLELITNAVIIPMSLFWAIFWFDAAQGRMNRFLERCRDHLRSALFISLFSNILVLIIWARHGNSGPTLLFSRVFASHLYENLVWRLGLLIVLVMCLVYLMLESLRLMIKHGKYEQAFHALSVPRRTDIVAYRDLIQLRFEIELEKELERVEHEPLLKVSRERLRILAWVEGAENWRFVVALILCVFQLLR